MSLNKFTDLSIKPWMNIGCNDIMCDELNCSVLKIGGEAIRVSPLVYSTLGNYTTASIYPAITTVVYEATPAIGTLTSTGYKGGDQLQIVTRGIINSATPSNIVSVYLYGGSQLTQIQIPSGAWTTSTEIVVTSIYNFINSTQAYFYSSVSLPGAIQNYAYGTVNFPALAPYNQTIALNAVAACSFSHLNTTITLI